MRRAGVVGAIVIAAVAVVVAVAAATSGPGLRFTDGTPDDLRNVASKAWVRFVDAVPACAGRLDGLTVGVAWELTDRARYEPESALVLIRAPGTAGNLEATLLHEFAHHAEHRCPPSSAFRHRFVTAAGLPAGTAWFGGDAWERIPSERFAEAAVRHVLGEPPPHVLVSVDPDEVRAVAAWAAGD
ncbi:MAG: hypothetical protein ACRDGO_00765 [Actinomycetota bacterium]